MICKNCGKEIDNKAVVCVHCGNSIKPKKPFYKKWWFILFAIIVAGVVALSLHSDGEKIVWSDMELGHMIPEPPYNKGEVYENTDKQLRIYLNKVSDSQYNDYLDACEEKGFTNEAEKTSFSYKAYNSNGYCLDMTHSGETLTLNLSTPMSLGSISWPTSTAGKQLPAPKSTTGKFNYEHDDNFSVYIGQTPKVEYDNYVSACSEKGFNIDYNKGETYYHADNSSGWHASIRYEGNNVMSISIKAPSKDEDITTSSGTNEDGELDPDFKTAMDSYESFMNEYVSFMNKYANNPTDLGLLSDYANYMSKYAEFVEDFEAWKDEDMNTAEIAYYADVQARVSKKLLEIAN